MANSIQGSPAKHKMGNPNGQFMGAVIQPNKSSQVKKQQNMPMVGYNQSKHPILANKQ